MRTMPTAFNKSRFFILCVLLFLGAVTTSLAQSKFIHGTAGFTVSAPFWGINVTTAGVEFTKGPALISVENLGISKGATSEILSLFVPHKDGSAVNSPYPGLRTSIQEKGYAAEVVILKTPVGFYLISLEQDQANPANLETFDALLNSFARLDTVPVDITFNLPNPVNLGPIDLAIPDGELEVQKTSLFWKSDAAGFLTAEIVKKGKGSLSQHIEAWEKEMLNEETGLSSRTSLLELTVEDRPAVQADYDGDKMLARVQVSELDSSNALILALIALKETFASHQPVLDAVSFSVVPAGDSSNTLTAQPTTTVRYNELVETVSDRFFLDAAAVNKLYKRQPALFTNIKKTIKRIDLLNKLIASSPEAAAKQIKWVDQADTSEFLKDCNAALRSYKVTLGLLPKTFTAPELPDKIYSTYTSARTESEPLLAYKFTLGAHDSFKGRDGVHKQLVDAKSQGAEVVSEQIRKYLQGKSSLYWRNRLEAKHQLSRLNANRDTVIENLWQQMTKDVQKIRKTIK